MGLTVMEAEMPKESVYEQPSVTALREVEEAGKPAMLAQKRKVSIGWARDTHVQLGVAWVDEAETAKLAASGGPLSWSGGDYIVDGETDEHMRVWRSQWMDLDRHGINELIRKLRRARDAAFGRDE